MNFAALTKVVSVDPINPVTRRRVNVTRQTGEVVLEGDAWCYTLCPQTPDSVR